MSNETRARVIEAGKVAALVALTRHVMTPDVGEMLTHGDGRLVPPNAINAMMTAALDAILAGLMVPDEAMIEAGFEAIRMEEKWPTLIDRIFTAMLKTLDAGK